MFVSRPRPTLRGRSLAAIAALDRRNQSALPNGKIRLDSQNFVVASHEHQGGVASSIDLDMMMIMAACRSNLRFHAFYASVFLILRHVERAVLPEDGSQHRESIRSLISQRYYPLALALIHG